MKYCPSGSIKFCSTIALGFLKANWRSVEGGMPFIPQSSHEDYIFWSVVLTVLSNTELHAYILTASQPQINASSRRQNTHLWPLPKLPSPSGVSWLLQEWKPAVQRGRHAWDTPIEPARCNYRDLHDLPCLLSALQAQLLCGVPGGMACCNGLFLQIGPASCGFSIRMGVCLMGRTMGCFHIYKGFEQYLLEEVLTISEAVWWLAFSPETDIPHFRFFLAPSCAIQLPK